MPPTPSSVETDILCLPHPSCIDGFCQLPDGRSPPSSQWSGCKYFFSLVYYQIYVSSEKKQSEYIMIFLKDMCTRADEVLITLNYFYFVE